MNELKIFENPKVGSVRTLEEDGKVLFCGSDVAKALGYAIPTKAVKTHCKGVSKMETPRTEAYSNFFLSPKATFTALSHTADFPTRNVLRSGYLTRFFPVSASMAHT